MTRKHLKRAVGVIGLTAFVFIAVALSVSWKYAKGGRTFFSPDTLETKSQSETLLIQTPVPLYRSSFSQGRYELVDFLIDAGYWSPAAADPPRWLPTNHWNRQWKDGQSPIHREFAWFADDWIAWTGQHPDIAAVLWPRVLGELRSNHPDCQWQAYRLMWHAKSAQTVEAFEQSLEAGD